MLKIVIADDEQNIVELIKRFCEYPSVEVIGEARNGVEAECILREKQPDMLITDIRMPGMNGLELIKRVKKDFPELEVVVISGFRVFDYIQSALKYGVSDFLLKPIDKSDLHKIFEQVLEKRKNNEQHYQYVENIEQNLRVSLARLRKEWLLKIVQKKMVDVAFLTDELFCFEAGSRFCISILKADCSSEGLEHVPYIITLLEKIGENISQILEGYGMDIIYACDGMRVFFAIHFPEAIDPNNFWRKQENGKVTLKDYLINEGYKYNFLRFSMGIGAYVENLNDIVHSYNTANEVINNRMNPSVSIVTGYSKLRKQCEKVNVYNLSRKDQEMFSNLIEGVDEKGIVNLFNNTLDRSIDETGDYSWIYEYAWAVVKLIRQVLIMKGTIDEFPDEYDIEGLIDNSYSIECLKERFAIFVGQVIEKVIEFKENKLSSPIRMAQEYVNENFASNIAIQEIASMVYLSTNYFSATFKAQTGMTFLDYLTMVRIEESKKLLRNSLLNVSEIAHSVGYSDEKYFSKLFMKKVGVKPIQYRKFYS